MKLNKLLIEKEYINNNKSTREVAKIFDCPKSTLLLFMKKNNIPLRQKRNRKYILEGQRYGKLKIISYDSTKSVYKCKCDCGKETICKGHHLRQLKMLSCGCSKYKHMSNNPRWKGFGKISSSLFSSYKSDAKRRGIEFNITIEYIWNVYLLQKGKCAISGLDINFPETNKDVCTASLDRIDSNKGYTIDNVQWLHKVVNEMKWDYQQEDFIKWCHIISKHNS